MDISAQGIWSRCEKTFMDVRVTHPTSQSHMRKSMETLYRENEREKKNLYNDRVYKHIERDFHAACLLDYGRHGSRVRPFESESS